MDCGFTYVDKQIQNTKIRIEMIKEKVG